MQISNAKEIVLHQNAEWSRVMAEESERQNLLRYGIMLLTAVYVVHFVLSLLFLNSISSLVTFSSTYVVSSILIQFALSIASLYITPAILAAIAPSFGGKNDGLAALKFYVFAATPAWLGTSVSAIPVLGWLAALAGGIFSIYLLWQHVSEAMSIPAEKKIGYVVVSILVLAAIYIVIGAVG